MIIWMPICCETASFVIFENMYEVVQSPNGRVGNLKNSVPSFWNAKRQRSFAPQNWLLQIGTTASFSTKDSTSAFKAWNYFSFVETGYIKAITSKVVDNLGQLPVPMNCLSDNSICEQNWASLPLVCTHGVPPILCPESNGSFGWGTWS